MLDLYDDYVKGNVKVRDHCHITGKKTGKKESYKDYEHAVKV